MRRHVLGPVVVSLARVLRWAFFRRHDVEGLDRLPASGPAVVVANHFNGFVDVVILVAALGRLPRFVAKSTIARNPVVRVPLRAAGVALVHRPEDRTGQDNRAMFSETTTALERGDWVAIFPEGTTHDRPSLARVRTGAARIALLAADAGVANVRVVPVGLTYHDKVSIRSSVHVAVGGPIAVDEHHRPASGEDGEPNRDEVEALTRAIEGQLRQLGPDFANAVDWRRADLAATVLLRTRANPEPSFAARAAQVRDIGALPSGEREGVFATVGSYLLAVESSGVDDRMVVGVPAPIHRWRLVVAGVVLVLASPALGVVLAVNALPAFTIAASGLVVREPVTKGTVRTLLAVFTFPLAWGVAAALLADAFAVQLAIVVGLALGGAACLVIAAVVADVMERAWTWRSSRERRAAIDELSALRREAVAAVRAVIDAGSGHSPTQPRPVRG